mmetsp:Transcript_39280/g.65863  ORF Transcript_39280/g.65863 Transcript_39280/m.65863 type:complete len:98 (-) Transcript_39280:27-320(-)
MHYRVRLSLDVVLQNYLCAGSTVPRASPNPIRYPFPCACPVTTTVSPSCRKALSDPSLSLMGFLPDHDNSSIDLEAIDVAGIKVLNFYSRPIDHSSC